jgi:chromosome segregation ATPase
MNTIFSYFKEKIIKSLYDLCNEFTLYQLMLSIEPNLKKIELEHGSEYSTKHKNFSKIIEILSNYITFHPDRVYFTPEADFASRLKIDGIIKCQKDQAILIGEMILFLSGISKNRESIERLDDCTDQSVMIYFNIQQKYSTKFNNDDENDENIEGEDNNNKDKDIENQNIQITLLCDKLKNEIQDKNRTILELQSHYDELENKYNLNNKELTNLKNATDAEFLAKEDLINQQILNDSLNNEIKELKLTNNNIKNEYESKIKALNYKLNVSNEKIVEVQLETEKYKSYVKENQRLKEKINLLNSYKDTDKKISELEKIINGKNDLIQELTKEKNKIQDKNISLIQELSQLKQDIFNLENKNLSLDNELRKIKNENQEIKLNQNIKNKNKKEKKDDNNEINLSQALLENDSNEEEEEDYKQKYLDMKDEMEMYKNIVNPLTEEKDKLETEIKELKETIEKLGGNKEKKNENNNIENEEMNHDKEINALKQKINEQNNISEELRKIVDNKEKKNDEYKKNLSEMQEQLETYKNAVGLLTEEKGEHINEIKKLKELNKKLESELFSDEPNNNINKDINVINNPVDNNKYSENAEKEIKELKEKINERDGLIETLQGIISGDKDITALKNDGEDYKKMYNKIKEEKEELEKRIKSSDEMNKKLEEEINTIKMNNDILNKEINELKDKNNNKIIIEDDGNYNKIINKKLDELISENENIKNNSINEHQLIASSMFELAIQYFQLKKELDDIKNLENSGESNLSWIENERKKNFPCEYYN